MSEETQGRFQSEARYIAATVVAAGTAFAVDSGVELGVTGGVLYVGVVGIAMYSRRWWLVIAAALACSILTVIGLVTSPQGGEFWKVLANRGLALFAIWVTALVSLRAIMPVDSRRETRLQTTLSGTWRTDIARPGWVLWLIIGLSLAIHVFCLVGGKTVFANFHWPHHPFHAAIEMAGGLIALWVAWMLVALHRRGIGTSYNVWIAGALIGMGLLDGLHAMVHAGQSFVWLHTVATFIGGLLFATVWLPCHWQNRIIDWWPSSVALTVSAFGIVSLVTPGFTLPMLVENDQGVKVFSAWSQGLNIGGGLLLFGAAARLLLTWRKTGNSDDLLFFLHSLLFGAAAIMFEQSQLWDLPWWGWHVLRLFAYAVAIWFVIETDRRDAAALRKRSVELHTLSAMVESSGDAIIGQTLTGEIISWNRGAQNLYQYSADVMVGEPIVRLFPPARSDDMSGILEQIRRGETVRQFETVQVRQDGSEFEVSLRISPIRDATGTLIGSSTVARDISERQRLEQRFKATIESAPLAMALIMVDSTGTIVLSNADTEKLFGYSRKELAGQSVEILIPERFRSGHRDLLQSYFKKPAARQMASGRDLYGQHKDGHEFFVEIGLNPVKTSEGVFVLVAVADITERKQSEILLLKQSEELRASNTELEQFAYVASHDLQEPLRAVAGYVQLLEMDYGELFDDDARKYMTNTVDGVVRMQTLIRDLLEYSRVMRNNESFRHTELSKSVSEACALLQVSIEENEAVIDAGPLPVVLADSSQMTRLFQNLIGNSIKYRSKEPPRIQITAEEDQEAGCWRIRFLDNGIGIEPRFAERIFVIFQRLHTREEYPGTGLGLAVCRRILERHGGTIHVDTENSAGTLFVINIPIEHDDDSVSDLSAHG